MSIVHQGGLHVVHQAHFALGPSLPARSVACTAPPVEASSRTQRQGDKGAPSLRPWAYRS
jgi:hypothetical protein